MATVENVARAALGDLAVDDGNVLRARRWVTDRYREFANRRLKQRRKVGTVDIPASITTGTVTVAAGTNTVDGDADAIAAWASQDLIGRYFQTLVSWYRISGCDGDTLQLDGLYNEAAVAAGGYRIVARTVALPNVQFLGTLVHARRRRPLQDAKARHLDTFQPNRQYSTGGPWFFNEVGVDAAGSRLIEIYPYSRTVEQISYVYWERVPDLFGLTDVLPDVVDIQALKEGVLVDVMRYKMAVAADSGQAEMATFWRNEYRMQETKWKDAIQRLVKADGGVDDLALLLNVDGSAPYDYPRDARSEIYARGNRP